MRRSSARAASKDAGGREIMAITKFSKSHIGGIDRESEASCLAWSSDQDLQWKRCGAGSVGNVRTSVATLLSSVIWR